MYTLSSPALSFTSAISGLGCKGVPNEACFWVAGSPITSFVSLLQWHSLKLGKIPSGNFTASNGNGQRPCHWQLVLAYA